MIVSFVFFLLLFTLVGLSSALRNRHTKDDYYLASRDVPAWLVGLSAVATNNSGYMFIGVIGYTYVTGLASIWLMIGWIAGDFLASLYIHSHLRRATEASGEVSYAGVLGHWHGGKSRNLQRLIGGLSLLFLLIYASAQLVAGSKALHVLLGWPLWSGAVMGSVLVGLYCFAGGIRASIWTDAVQSFVMIVSMGLLLVIAVDSLGGGEAALQQMNEIDGFMNLFPDDLVVPGLVGGVIFAMSWLFAGFSVIGQPHIMVRFMALQNVSQMKSARTWYYLWFVLFYCSATAVGMLSRLFIADTGSFDAELALPTMAQQLMPPLLVGVILAGIFSATMSTADSLILSCSSAITHDLLPSRVEKTWLLKLTTLLITLVALVIALGNQQSVFNLVIMSWSGLASAFAPLLIVLSLNMKPSHHVSMLAVVTGFTVALLWRLAGFHTAVYEGLPGMVSGLLVFFISGYILKTVTRRDSIA